MSEYFDNLSQGEHGSLAIGSGTFYCTYVLPELIQQFQSLHPAVQVNPVETSSNRGLQMLTRGQLDFSLDVNEIHDCALESTVVAQSIWSWLSRPSCPATKSFGATGSPLTRCAGGSI